MRDVATGEGPARPRPVGEVHVDHLDAGQVRASTTCASPSRARVPPGDENYFAQGLPPPRWASRRSRTRSSSSARDARTSSRRPGHATTGASWSCTSFQGSSDKGEVCCSTSTSAGRAAGLLPFTGLRRRVQLRGRRGRPAVLPAPTGTRPLGRVIAVDCARAHASRSRSSPRAADKLDAARVVGGQLVVAPPA